MPNLIPKVDWQSSLDHCISKTMIQLSFVKAPGQFCLWTILFGFVTCQDKPTFSPQIDTDAAFGFKYHLIDSVGVKNPWAKMFGDLNGDGSPDIIIGGQKGPLVWYRNPDWKLMKISGGGYDTVDGEAGDMDGDGDIDVVMGGLYWYENPGTLSQTSDAFWETHQIADHPTHDVELADINNDGLLDIVTRNQSDFGTMKGNTIHVWIQGVADDWSEEIIECDHGEGLKVIDLDKDGDIDIIGTGFWFENSLTDPWRRHDITKWHASSNLSVGDFNGDGRLDIVLTPSELAKQDYKISWFEQPENLHDDVWPEHSLVDSIECVIHGVAAGDFNGDDMTDITYSEMHQGRDPDEVVALINRADGKQWDKVILSERGSHSIEVVDINQDGLPDIFGANWSGDYQPIELWLSTN